MGRGQPSRGSGEHPGRIPPTVVARVDPRCEVPPLHELHRDEDVSTLGADVERGHDVGMRQGGHGPRLPDEAGDGVGLETVQELDGDVAAEAWIVGPEHATHRARSDALSHLVATDRDRLRVERVEQPGLEVAPPESAGHP